MADFVASRYANSPGRWCVGWYASRGRVEVKA